ncbi:type II secretion system protein GspC [Thiomicrospira microaerophila]|uniref:type II secretion system protein GspC n=1 Tax=Thiomicrospira microaerophila TaxID=406020 RepID=UPI00200D22D4|nr:type II secretion system protein GspC [Thiomicrospira microaerophila]UQB41717.1 type II secretion system protein GspC [Thiomicrospira microaerophila]
MPNSLLFISNGVLRKWLGFVLLMLISWQVGVWLAQNLNQVDPPLLPSLEPLAIKESPKLGLLQLWGTPPAAAVVPVEEPVVVEAPPVRATRLNLKLLGVIRAEAFGVAIIQTGRDTKVLTVGEELQSNVKLDEIGADYVIIKNRGAYERLTMESQSDGLLVVQHPETPVLQPDQIHQVASQQPQNTSSTGGVLATEQSQQLQLVSQEIRQNPMRIGQYVRFEPLRERGEWLGIRIGPRNHPEIFGALGFREGDLVVSINGLTVADMAENPAVWNQFLQESRFSLVVNRNGLNETIDVDLNP